MVEYRFDLTFAGVTTTLAIPEEQPEGISSLDSVLHRDFDAAGAFFKFTGGDLKLKFPGTGKQILKTARNTDGIDAVVTFEMFKRPDEFQSFTSVFLGTAIMENLFIDIDFAEVDFDEIGLLQSIIRRQEVPAPLDATEDMDGNVISAAAEETITVEGRPILQTSAGIARKDTRLIFDPGSAAYTTITAIFEELSNEIEWTASNGFEAGAAATAPTASGIMGGNLRAELEFDPYTAIVTIGGSVGFRNPGGTVTGSFILRLIETNDSGFTNHDLQTFSWADYNQSGNEVEQIPLDFTLSFPITEDTIFDLEWQVSSAGGSGTATIFTDGRLDTLNIIAPTFTFSITVNRTAPESEIGAVFIHEALRHNLEQISGNVAGLDAPFFGRTEDGYPTDGAAAFFVQFNGYRARGFDTRSIVNIFKDSLESLISIFNVGYGIEEAYIGGAFTLKIAPREYFFANVQLVAFPTVIEYGEEFFDWFLFNKIEIGYEKFSGDDEFPGTLNDFNTLATYLTPFINVEGTKAFKSKYVGSDILLEITRRKQFDVTPTESWKYDDDLFIMDVQDIYDTGAFVQGSIYDVANIGIDYAGLTPINLTINPRFNAYNFFSIFNTLLYKKALTAPFRNQEYKVNGTEKIFYTGGSPELGDTEIHAEGAEPQVNQNLVALESGDRLFDPIKISFKVAMSSQEVDDIIKAHRNALPSGNYGYISVTNNEGETFTGWILDLKYNVIDEIGSFELIKRSENYQI